MYCKVDNSPYGYIKLTAKGHIKEVNERFLEILGFAYDEVIDKHIEVFLSMASKMVFHSLFFMQLQFNGKSDELYLTFKRKTGEDIPALLMGNTDVLNDETYINCILINMSKKNDYEKELISIRSELENAYKMKEAALSEETRLRELFQTTLLSISDGIIVTDNKGKITTMNFAAENFTGYLSKDAYGLDFNIVFNNINSKSRTKTIDIVKHVIENEENVILPEYELLISKNETERYITGNANIIYSELGDKKGIVVSFSDVTKEYQQEKEIQWFLNVNIDMLCVSDLKGRLVRVNQKFADVLGYSIDELEGQFYFSLIKEEDIADTRKAVKHIKEKNYILSFTNRYQRKDGTFIYIEWNSELNGKYIYSSARDVTAKHLEEQQLRGIAERDELTGLHNRHFFYLKLNDELTKADLNNEPISMIIFDIDHFKQINDTYGHPIGDEVLKEISQIVSKSIRKTDLFIRFGGEEFIILMPATTGHSASIVAEKIRSNIEKNINPTVGTYTASFGVSERMKSECFKDWYEKVDKALYNAKYSGRNKVVNYI